MKRELAAKISYDNVDFRFISDHYDVHLSGTCIYNDALHDFENDYPSYNEEKDEYEDMSVRIYSLDFYTRLKRYWKQWLFEQYVGYHWTYPYRKNRSRPFKYRNPKWFYTMLFKWFYKL